MRVYTQPARTDHTFFEPANVTIGVGNSVTWKREGRNAHSVTQGTTPDPSQDPSRLFAPPP